MTKQRGVELMVKTKMYNIFEQEVSGTGKKLMLALLKLMDNDTNLIQINGVTLDTLLKTTGLSESQVRNKTSELKKYYLIESTGTRSEYIINPMFAVKGNASSVWRMYGKLERLAGNTEATIPYVGAVKLEGSARALTANDLKIIGLEAKEQQKIMKLYYD